MAEIGKKSLAQKFQDMEAAMASYAAQDEKIIALIGAEEKPEDLMAALQEKFDGMAEQINTLTIAAEDAATAQASAIAEAQAGLIETHTQQLEEFGATHTQAIEALTERAEAAELLASERGKKLEDPAYQIASIEGQEPVDTGAAGEDGEPSLYDQYNELKKTDPGAAAAFWKKNQAEILESAR